MFLLFVVSIFVKIFFTSFGDKNWPFLILTILDVWAAATIKSVCLAKKAGIWRISTWFAARLASLTSWISVVVGIEKLFPTFFKISKARALKDI